MICRQCGTEFEDDLETCPSCGAPVDRDADIDADALEDADAQSASDGVLDEDPDSEFEMLEAQGDDAESEDDEEVVEYVRHEGFATFMPIDQETDEGIDVEPDDLAGLEPFEMRDLDEDEVATTSIGPSYQVDAEAPKSHRGLKIFLTVLIILLVAAGAACGIGYYKYKDRIAHEDVAVHVVMDVPGYPAGEESSTIPVRVAGMDLDGNSIDERMYFEEASGDITLKRGQYQISASGTPVTGEGTIYRYPKHSVSIEIDETGVHAAGSGAKDDEGSEDAEQPQKADDADSSATFMGEKVHLTYEQIAPERISDSMIDDAVAWMADSELDSPKVETLKAAIAKARDDRLKQMEEEKKALEKQRREEELKSALAANPSKVDSTKKEWSFTGTVVEFNVEHEEDGTVRYYKQYALEIPEEATFDIVSKDDAKKLEEQQKAAEEDEKADEAADSDEEKADEKDGDSGDEKAGEKDGDSDEEEADEPDLVEPVKSTKIIMLSSVSSDSADTIAASPWAEYVGKTVTVKGKLSQSITDTPDNEHSQIRFADDARAVKVFEDVEE